MAIYDIPNANGDYYYNNIAGFVNDTDTLLCGINNLLTYYNYALGLIDTSGIPDGDTISAATFYVYVDSITATKGATKSFLVSVGGNYAGTISASTAGWKSLSLPSGSLSDINKTGSTGIILDAYDPGEEMFIAYAFRAYEYDVDDTYDMYLDVTHGEVEPITVKCLAALGVG